MIALAKSVDPNETSSDLASHLDPSCLRHSKKVFDRTGRKNDVGQIRFAANPASRFLKLSHDNA